MERRKALALAGSITIGAATAAAALAINLGLLGTAGADPVGKLTADQTFTTPASTGTTIVYEDILVTDPVPASGGSSTALTPSSIPSSSYQPGYPDHEAEDDDEDESHENESDDGSHDDD
jgi:hypothetical protein